MVYYSGLALIAAPFLIWLWHILPKREKVYAYNYDYPWGSQRQWTGKYRWDSYFETWWTAMFGYLGLAFLWLAAVGIWAIVLAGLQNWLQADFTPDSEKDENLVALTTSEKTSGSFFLASGYSDEEQTFSFLSMAEDGGVRLGEVYADSAVVYEDEQDKPFYTTYTWIKYDPWISPFGSNIDYTYSFHIPEGSIVSTYEVAP